MHISGVAFRDFILKERSYIMAKLTGLKAVLILIKFTVAGVKN